MKSNKNNRKAQFGRIGVVSLMALSLSSQHVFALDLWYLSGPNKDKKLESLIDSDKTAAVESLTKFEVTDFVEKFASKPNQFFEAIQEALKKNKSISDFKEKLKEAFSKVEASKFGGDKQKEIYAKLIERALGTDAESEEFLDLILASSKDREALNITFSKPEKKENPEVGEQEKADAEFKAFCDSVRAALGKKQEEVDKFASLLEELKASNDKNKEELDRERLAGQERLANLENELLKANANLTALSEQAAQVEPAQVRKQDQDATDVLNGLLGSLVNDQNQRNAEDEEVAPANNNQFPFFPQQARVNPGNANQFNQPLPQANNLPFLPNQSSLGPNVPVTYDLGVTGGRPELADAQEIVSMNEMRQPVASSISPMAGIQELVVGKARVSADIKRTQVALQNAKDKAAQLDERLEELKEGGRAALSPSVKQRLAQLKQAVETKQSYLNQQRQMLSMLSPDQREQLNNTLMQAQMDLSNAEQQYNQFNSQVEVAVEQANGQIKALAKQRDQLNSAANKLQSQMSSLKEDETAVTQLINNQMQAQMQMMNNAGTPNINRISNRGTTPRRVSPLGAAVSGANGNVVRPSLAK